MSGIAAADADLIEQHTKEPPMTEYNPLPEWIAAYEAALDSGETFRALVYVVCDLRAVRSRIARYLAREGIAFDWLRSDLAYEDASAPIDAARNAAWFDQQRTNIANLRALSDASAA